MKWAALKPRLPRSIKIFHDDIDDTCPANAARRPPPVSPERQQREQGNRRVGMFAGYPCHNSRIIARPIRPRKASLSPVRRGRASRRHALRRAFIRRPASRHPQSLPPVIPCTRHTILLRCRHKKQPPDCEAARSCPRPTIKDHASAVRPARTATSLPIPRPSTCPEPPCSGVRLPPPLTVFAPHVRELALEGWSDRIVASWSQRSHRQRERMVEPATLAGIPSNGHHSAHTASVISPSTSQWVSAE